MATKYKNTLFQLSVAVGCFMLLAPSAHALIRTPLDCPWVVAVNNGYRLTQDTTCNIGWDENNKFFDLDGFTLTTDSILAINGNALTIRNGEIHINQTIYWIGSNGTLSKLSVKSAYRGFVIEAGSNFTVKDSVFTNIPGVALDFYYGSGGKVKNSTFIGNGIGISIQQGGNNLIENNKFVGNTRGVNLYDEDGGGVNFNKIKNNHFRENEMGIKVLALSYAAGGRIQAMEGNQIVGNRISRSSHSGLLIEVACESGGSSAPPICGAQNMMVSGNRLNRNGFGALTSLPIGVEPDDDGLTARAYVREPINQQTPYPEGLAGVTLTNNRADRNADLGFDVEGVTDGGGQVAEFNGNLEQCIGLECNINAGVSLSAERNTIIPSPLTIIPKAISFGRSSTLQEDTITNDSFEAGQMRHTN